MSLLQHTFSVTEKKMGETTTGAAAFAMPVAESRPNNGYHQQQQQVEKKKKRDGCCDFQMPLHYPRYSKSDYETMPEWKLDCLLKEYGLPVTGDVYQKRDFAMGAFLWP